MTITIENVRFPPNSDRLLAREQEKLRRIAEILKKYPDSDILITGHTARAPGYTEQDYQDLSEQRAGAVADFLLSLGARRPAQMTTRGMGARVPVGRQRHRGGHAEEQARGDHDPGELIIPEGPHEGRGQPARVRAQAHDVRLEGGAASSTRTSPFWANRSSTMRGTIPTPQPSRTIEITASWPDTSA